MNFEKSSDRSSRVAGSSGNISGPPHCSEAQVLSWCLVQPWTLTSTSASLEREGKPYTFPQPLEKTWRAPSLNRPRCLRVWSYWWPVAGGVEISLVQTIWNEVTRKGKAGWAGDKHSHWWQLVSQISSLQCCLSLSVIWRTWVTKWEKWNPFCPLCWSDLLGHVGPAGSHFLDQWLPHFCVLVSQVRNIKKKKKRVGHRVANL